MRQAIHSKDEFRIFLQNELVRRCRANPGYSLRAYARSLRISPSALSSMLNGKRPITLKSRLRLGKALDLSREQIQHFSVTAKKGKRRLLAGRFQQVSMDMYAVISDWYHYAILELTHVENFKPSTKWVARTLGLTVSEVQAAVERLERVGLLRIENNNWIDTTDDGRATNLSGDLTSQGKRALQKQILEKSIVSLETLSLSVRDHSSMTFAINPEDLPEAKERIKNFRRELCTFFEQNPRHTEVYQLAISLFPLTQIQENI